MKYKYLLLLLALIASTTSCKKYLDAKPDKALVIPATLADLQALLDQDNLINETDPMVGEVASDNYYIKSTYYFIIPSIFQQSYIWNDKVRFDNDYTSAYSKLYTANLVLDYIDKVRHSSNDLEAYNSIKGQAFFIRGYSLYLAAQIYTLPYSKGINDDELGMPLKLSSDINEPTSRATLKNTYAQIVSDIKMACIYLPNINLPVTRAGKAAAYAALTNVYLQMQDYQLANTYADSTLMIKNSLIDYNGIDSTLSNPIPKDNIEILYNSRIVGAVCFNPVVYRIDSILYNSYSSQDLRKSIFFKGNDDKSVTFKGGYDNNNGQIALFNGLSIDEIYLIKAETAARLKDLINAGKYLNLLLQNRYKIATFTPYSFTNENDALGIILSERRKELVFRAGKRWNDLRRLNLEPQFASTLIRSVDGVTYTLSPNDLRYAFLIPESVIIISGIKQNAR